jgi:hypothetical protein
LGPIGDIDADRLFGIGDGVAQGVGQRNGRWLDRAWLSQFGAAERNPPSKVDVV